MIDIMFYYSFSLPGPGKVVVERSPGLQEVSALIPGHVKQKTLNFEILLLCSTLSTKELETDWPPRSQDKGLGWDITAYLWRGVSLGYSIIKTGHGSG